MHLERALREGLVVRLRRGVHVLSSATPEVAAAASVRGVLSHASAAQGLGLPLLNPQDAVHVTVPRRRHTIAPPGVVLHWVDLAPTEILRGCTHYLRTVLDCASALPFADALAVADGALREGWLTPQRLATAADASRDTPYVVDLADRARRIALEADSFAHHGTREALRRDCHRYDEHAGPGRRPAKGSTPASWPSRAGPPRAPLGRPAVLRPKPDHRQPITVSVHTAPWRPARRPRWPGEPARGDGTQGIAHADR